jgi:hypothetical protein
MSMSSQFRMVCLLTLDRVAGAMPRALGSLAWPLLTGVTGFIATFIVQEELSELAHALRNFDIIWSLVRAAWVSESRPRRPAAPTLGLVHATGTIAERHGLIAIRAD